MSLSRADVSRLAELARIGLGGDEIEATLVDLRSIFALIQRMQTVDTAGIAPMAHAQDVTLRLREDRVTEVDQREIFQRLAPQTEAGLYLVPKVIE
ncbi:MAG TPA: Asp-tRNA(Asn)/Glu-tRNA(Gln) amidotransferase subunit GatC [Burkholderiales bacterium]|nr:Asp-tRNA(Asn)/Glu-tRNA(Gln) amidotransferase subunit GatC [Burkholderiales bacterium]